MTHIWVAIRSKPSQRLFLIKEAALVWSRCIYSIEKSLWLIEEPSLWGLNWFTMRTKETRAFRNRSSLLAWHLIESFLFDKNLLVATENWNFRHSSSSFSSHWLFRQQVKLKSFLLSSLGLLRFYASFIIIPSYLMWAFVDENTRLLLLPRNYLKTFFQNIN